MASEHLLGFRVRDVVSIPFLEGTKYVVGSIRTGGMGAVYKLVPLTMPDQPLALKTYQTNGDIETFNREARIWIQLSSHPHVAKALAYGQIHNNRCVVAKWYSTNLIDTPVSKLSYEQLVQRYLEIVDALSFGWKMFGLLHKDIKPQNILLDSLGTAKVADYGISSTYLESERKRYQQAETLDFLTRGHESKSAVCGTPFYMAPELFSGEPNSVASELFALGVTFWQLVFREHPFLDETGRVRMRSLLEMQKEFRLRVGDPDGRFSEVVLRSVSLDPDQRPESYDEVQEYVGMNKMGGHPRRNQTGAEVLSTIAYCTALKRQGKIGEAIQILGDSLKKNQNDVMLLSALSTALLGTGESSKALELLALAVDLNKRNNCRYLNRIYVEPNINLAQLLLRDGQYHSACTEISHIAPMIRDDEPESQLYWEIAWWHLYQQRPNEADQFLLRYCSNVRPVVPVVVLCCVLVLTLANSASGASKYYQLLCMSATDSVEHAQCLLVLATLADPKRAETLVEPWLSSDLLRELHDVSVSLCGNREFFRIPLDPKRIRILLATLNRKHLGGSFDELF